MKKIINHFEKLINQKKEDRIMEGAQVFKLDEFKNRLREIENREEKIEKICDMVMEYLI